MAVTNFTTNLGLALPTTGDLSGTWGDTVNTAITELLDTAIAGTVTLSTDADVTLTTTTGASNQARSAVILWTAANAVTRNITAPAHSKAYVVINAGTGSVVIRGVGPTTGVTIGTGVKALVAWNGSDFVLVSSATVALSAVTGLGTGVGTALAIAVGSAGAPVVLNGALGTPSTGTLTNCTFPTLNQNTTGYASALKSATTTVSVSAATAPTNGQVLTASSGTAATWATPATGVSLSAANTWTATQTFSGSTSTFGTALLDSNETVNVVAAAPSATTNFYVQSGSVQYYTTNAANNWTLNIAFSSVASMNGSLAIGKSVTFTLVTTQNATAYYNNAVTIDGASVTPKWLGGAPTAGNVSGLDVYRFAVIKTANATYTVLASLTQYK